MRCARFCLLVLPALCLAGIPALALQTDNHGMHAVPAPGNVTIDGKLDDWDLSGQILACYDVASLKDIYSARIAMMYDSDAFYVAVHWKDPTPMGNSHDPRFQAGDGWKGDCVQLRFRTDRITHVTAWYSAPKHEPFINLAYGKDLAQAFGGGGTNLFRTEGWKLQDGAEMAFLKDADGKGYVQEIKLPWKLIASEKQYAAGDTFACGIELLWGEADWPVHRYADNLAEGVSGREFFFSAPTHWGSVLLEPRGHLNLPAQPWDTDATPVTSGKTEGPVAIRYGLSKDSRVTLAIDDVSGRRVRNLLAAAERKGGANTDFWDCMDDKGNIVPPGNYTVKGLSHDGLHLKYAGSFANPGVPAWDTADNKGAFYADHTPPQAAAAGSNLVALACPMGEAGKHLICVDMHGRRQWGLPNRMFCVSTSVALATDGNTLWVANEENSGRFTIWRCELATGIYSPWKRKGPDGKDVLDIEILPPAARGAPNCRAIAVHNGVLAVILTHEQTVLLLNAETGETLKKYELHLDRLWACAFAPDGTLYIVDGESLHTLNQETGALTKHLDTLDCAQGMAVDKNGNIYISQRSKKQNVEVFSPEFKLLRVVGKPGGRSETGFFDPAGMRNPGQIAVDAQGRVWVPEATMQPKRTSVWDKDGKLVLDLVGTTGYAAGGIVNPLDPTRGICEQVEYKLDFKNQKYKPLFTMPSALGSGYHLIAKIVKINGREYAQGKAQGSATVNLFLHQSDGAWRQVAEWGNVSGTMYFESAAMKEFKAKNNGKAYLWVDKNDDGQAQLDEIQTNNVGFGAYYWCQSMGDDMTVAEPIGGGSQLMLFKPQGFTPGGTPLYSFSSATLIQPAVKLGGEGMMAVGRGGRFYLNQDPLTGLGPDGNVLWTYPNPWVSVHGSHNALASGPGLLIGPSSIYGTAFVNRQIGEVFYLNGNLGQNFIFTEDGLWVQSLYHDCRAWYEIPSTAIPGMSCDNWTAGGESFGGSFCKSDDGKIYQVGGGTAPVAMEITGLDTLKRFGLQVEVTPKDLVAAQDVKVRLAARTASRKGYVATKTSAPLAVDGNPDDWAVSKDSIEINLGSSKVGASKAAYDDNNLYLAWVVNGPAQLKNGGQDERLMFKTGDCVDFMLRTDASNTEAKCVQGDMRLLVTVKAGKPLAVLYRPVAPGAPKEEAAAFSSPWRTVKMDSVRTVEFPLTATPVPGGCLVRAAIPLKLLGVDSLRGKTLRGDFGVLKADSSGQRCTSRNYWSNKTANNTSDIPDEAILTPPLWGDLTFRP